MLFLICRNALFLSAASLMLKKATVQGWGEYKKTAEKKNKSFLFVLL